MARTLAEGGPQPKKAYFLDFAIFHADSKLCVMKQQRKEELEKSKQIKLITKHVSSTHSAEQEAPPPTL